ncbi:flagellar hook-basal body protein [Priestia koreensis]|uniref:Uncharacterized protein n=1 Tax=Priestia koreensis TaxID=284581 RepID=A0A0M0KEI2_9BACI|nr:flagellar hook-basal body protein [Priestia koreensis]KOO37256.1 hypothetical protein AMD01_22565 [Priestia koreensis]
MNRSMINASNTMGQLQYQIDVIGDNLANVNTNGFKSRDVSFSDLLYQQFDNQPDQQKEQGRLTPYGIRQGSGAKLSQTYLQMNQGSFIQTNRALDAALQKEDQFFQVRVNQDGQQVTQYTRDGAFYISPNGTQSMLVDRDGNSVLDAAGNPIAFPQDATDVQITASGAVEVTTPAGKQSIDLGIVQVNKPQLLEAKGNNHFQLPNLGAMNVTMADVLTPLAPGANRNDILQTKALEQSNVDVSQQMTNLTMAQKAYQFNARAISMSDQMMGLVNTIRS